MKAVKLSDIASLTVGFVGTMAEHYSETGITFLRSLNIKPYRIDSSDMKYITAEFARTISKSELHTNDVVIVRTGIPGTCCVVPNEYDGSNCSDVVIVHPDLDKVNPHYLAAYINEWGQRQVSNNKVGAIQKHFNVHTAENMVVFLPDKKTQTIVAAILCNLNDKIAKNEAICAELESMAKSLYDYWFVQFDFPDGNGKPYRTSGGEMVKSELTKELIPSGWEHKKLNNVCSLRNGINYDKTIDGDQEYRIINVRDISSSSTLINENALDAISLPSRLASKYTITEQDIIVARSGTPGATRLLLKPKEQTIFCGFIICCTPREASMRLYLTHTLKRLEGTSATKTGGSILQNVSQETLKSLSVVIPDENVIRQFNEIVSPWYDCMQKLTEENNILSELRDWLLPMLMNGQAVICDMGETMNLDSPQFS